MGQSTSKSQKVCELIYIVAGSDDSLVSAECEKLLDELVEPQQRATGLFSVDSGSVSVSQVLEDLQTLPFLTEKRVVLLKRADDFVSKYRSLLEKYFDNPCPTSVLVLTVSSWPANTKLAKKLAKVGRLITVTQPKAWQLPGRLISYSSDAHSKKLTREAAELLIELTGDDLGALYAEIDKLALFADAENSITPRHVELLTGHNRLFNAFAVIDALTAGQTDQAIDRLRHMFAESKSAEYTVVGAFAFHFRRMFNAKALLKKGLSTNQVAKRLRIWGNQGTVFKQLQKVSLKQLGDIIQRLAAIDYAIKTGRTKAQVAIEQLVFGLAADLC